jgi:D-aminoacyl-tRNA deacylase
MNIREKFLSSKSFIFEKVDFTCCKRPVFRLIRNSNENEIFLGLTKDPLIFLNDIELNNSELKPDFLIFASRHRSETARPAFLVHTTGNWSNDADFGGEPQELSKTSALLYKAGFISLIEVGLPPLLKNFSIDLEVTHHGPTSLEKPLIFMEIGSSKKEWKIDMAGVFLTNAIISTIDKYSKFKKKGTQLIGLGFGGTHYAPNFHRIIKNTSIAVSFICPKYYIQALNRDLIKKMIENTLEKIDFFIVDWKGTNSEDKKHLIPILEEFEIPIKKTKDFKQEINSA